MAYTASRLLLLRECLFLIRCGESFLALCYPPARKLALCWLACLKWPSAQPCSADRVLKETLMDRYARAAGARMLLFHPRRALRERNLVRKLVYPLQCYPQLILCSAGYAVVRLPEPHLVCVFLCSTLFSSFLRVTVNLSVCFRQRPTVTPDMVWTYF